MLLLPVIAECFFSRCLKSYSSPVAQDGRLSFRSIDTVPLQLLGEQLPPLNSDGNFLYRPGDAPTVPIFIKNVTYSINDLTNDALAEYIGYVFGGMTLDWAGIRDPKLDDSFVQSLFHCESLVTTMKDIADSMTVRRLPISFGQARLMTSNLLFKCVGFGPYQFRSLFYSPTHFSLPSSSRRPGRTCRYGNHLSQALLFQNVASDSSAQDEKGGLGSLTHLKGKAKGLGARLTKVREGEWQLVISAVGNRQ
jgi:hypothetical protein